jgi:hypothetical protein
VVEWSGEWRGWLGFKLPRSVGAHCSAVSALLPGVLLVTLGSPLLSLSPSEREKIKVGEKARALLCVGQFRPSD